MDVVELTGSPQALYMGTERKMKSCVKPPAPAAQDQILGRQPLPAQEQKKERSNEYVFPESQAGVGGWFEEKGLAR